MRSLGWPLTGLLIASPALLAQQPPAGQTLQTPPLNPAANDPLPGLLQQWEQRMKNIQGIEASIIRTETDDLTKSKEIYDGRARFLRPDRADLYLLKRTVPPQQPATSQQFERYVFTGNALYEFRPKQQLLVIHQFKRAPGQQIMDNNFLSLLFGMTAQEAQRRYSLRLAGTDKFYHYLEIKPLLPADQKDFTLARLVLWATGPSVMLPRQVTFMQTNGNPIEWEIPAININPKLGPTDFQRPPTPKGWQEKVEPAPTAAAAMPPPPSKVRPSGSP
jgi:TIGR03009 family protein